MKKNKVTLETILAFLTLIIGIILLILFTTIILMIIYEVIFNTNIGNKGEWAIT